MSFVLHFALGGASVGLVDLRDAEITEHLIPVYQFSQLPQSVRESDMDQNVVHSLECVADDTILFALGARFSVLWGLLRYFAL